MIQRHYNDETYQLQIDSHHRFGLNWDINLIEQLHNCDAGEYSVLSTYPAGFSMEDNSNGYSEATLELNTAIPAMRWF